MPKAWLREDGYLEFRCPGCNEIHDVYVGPDPQGRPRWQHTGTEERPTLSPSILIRTGHYTGRTGPEGQCWCTYNAEHPGWAPFKCAVCHSFVRDGMIQFCGDSTHALSGQTVPLPEVYEGAQLEAMKAKRGGGCA